MDGERPKQDNVNISFRKSYRKSDETVYVPPTITTYSSEEILEQVGPAQACSPAPCGVN